MADLPKEWQFVRDLSEGGQGHTFVVNRADGSDEKLYVLKRLKNLKRQDRFFQEIEVCTKLDHPNVLKVLGHGLTPKKRPFLITPYCSAGSLKDHPTFTKPIDGLRYFQSIVAGVAYAHSREPAVYHLDIKPENIVIGDKETPIVGDFGICFVEDSQLCLTSDGPHGSMYYCAPELRGPQIETILPLGAADAYSLGKVLYWLFTRIVYDGHEEDYGNRPARKLAVLFPDYPQFSFIDALISRLVQRDYADRLQDAIEVLNRVRTMIARIEAGGHVLDLRIPQRCLYCGTGTYRPGHEQVQTNTYMPPGQDKFPKIEKRRIRESPGLSQASMYDALRATARVLFGSHHMTDFGNGIPILLICDHCGNVQLFRLDCTSDGYGANWLP